LNSNEDSEDENDKPENIPPRAMNETALIIWDWNLI
jgi:hypothetical protein